MIVLVKKNAYDNVLVSIITLNNKQLWTDQKRYG